MDNQYRTSRVIIQNTLDSVEPVIRYLRGVATLIGLDDREVHRICYAVEETLENSILFDFEPDETEEIEIRINRIAAGLEVVISDHGIPRNPFAEPPRSLDEIAADISFDTIAESDGDRISALSSFVIHRLLDRYTQVNRGKEGRSVEMVIFAAGGRITEEAGREETGHPADEKKFSLIRSATASDIIGISRLFYKSYGYSYVNDIVYYPERLTSAVASGMLRSSVAVSDTGEVIGHIALMEPYEGAEITEWGMAISDPGCRGQGVMTALVEEIMQEFSLAQYRGMFAHSVTNHAFTQKICAAHGFSDVALLVGYAGADLSFKKIHRRLRQRESTIISYKPLTTLEMPRLFLPDHHREMITRLYRGIGVKIEQNQGSPAAGQPAMTRLRDTIVPSINIAEIVLEQAGEDSGEIIAEATRKNCLARVDVIYLVIDLEDPRAAATVAACEEKGYIFAGIFPGYHHDHALVLQYFNNLRFDYSLITSYSPLAEELKKYIEQCAETG